MAMVVPLIVGVGVVLFVNGKVTKWKQNFWNWVDDIKFQDYLKHRLDPEFLRFKQQWTEFQVEGKLYELYKESRLHHPPDGQPPTGKEASDTSHVKLVQP